LARLTVIRGSDSEVKLGGKPAREKGRVEVGDGGWPVKERRTREDKTEPASHVIVKKRLTLI